MTVKSWGAFLIGMGCLLFAFIWNTYYPNSAFGAFAGYVVGILGLYFGKRIAQKHTALGGGGG